MVSIISIMVNGDFLDDKIEYCSDCETSMINYIMQYIKKDFNTFKYPDKIEGIRTIKDNLGNRSYYNYTDNKHNDIVIQSVEHY